MRSASMTGLVASAFLVIGSPQAVAQTDTATMPVTATVESGCSLTGGSLDFGTYTSGQSTNRDVTGRIDYANCNGTLTFELDGGGSGNVNARAMSSDGSSLSYQLYQNSGRTDLFGTGADALSALLFEPQSGFVNVYGRIPAGQAIAAGVYSDTINITLSF